MKNIIIAVALVMLGMVLYKVTNDYLDKYRPFLAEDKINAAIPISPLASIKISRVRNLLNPEKLVGFEHRLNIRLRMRALDCAKNYFPKWYDSKEKVVDALHNEKCFSRQDEGLIGWLDLIEVGALLQQEELRAIPVKPLTVYEGNDFLHHVNYASDAGVAIFHSKKNIQVIDLNDGKPISERPTKSYINLSGLSSNGRLFAMSEGGENKLLIIESDTGNVITEILGVNGSRFKWIDTVVAAFNNEGGGANFIDFEAGEIITEKNTWFGNVMANKKVAGHYILIQDGSAAEVALANDDGEKKLVITKQINSSSSENLAITSYRNTGYINSDGETYISGHRVVGFGFLSLATLDLEQVNTGRFSVYETIPTSSSDEIIISGRLLPIAHNPQEFFVYNRKEKTFRVLALDRFSTRIHYAYPLKSLGLINQSKLIIKNDFLLGEPIKEKEWHGEMTYKSTEIGMNLLIRKGDKNDTPDRASSSVGQKLLQDKSHENPPIALRNTSLRNVIGDSRIEGIGVYEAVIRRPGGAGNRPGTITVNVNRSERSLVLVLSSYESVNWVINRKPGSNLAAVLVSSYYPSQVEGVGNAQILQVGRFHTYNQSSNNYQLLNAEVERLLGKSIDNFQGAYSESSFSAGDK